MNAVTEAAPGTGPQEQGTLEGWTVVKVPQWSREGLMEHIVELVVVDDQVRNVKVVYVTITQLVTHRPFPLWTMQHSIDCSGFNALLPRTVISPTAQVLPMLSMRKHSRSRIF